MSTVLVALFLCDKRIIEYSFLPGTHVWEMESLMRVRMTPFPFPELLAPEMRLWLARHPSARVYRIGVGESGRTKHNPWVRHAKFSHPIAITFDDPAPAVTGRNRLRHSRARVLSI